MYRCIQSGIQMHLYITKHCVDRAICNLSNILADLPYLPALPTGSYYVVPNVTHVSSVMLMLRGIRKCQIHLPYKFRLHPSRGAQFR